MKTVILCGGRGYRLKEETDFKPKPMVTIGDKPILWHIMKIYESYGFNDFVVALGYKGNEIKNYFLNQKYFARDFTLAAKNGKVLFHKNKQSQALDDFTITFIDTGLESLTGERIRRLKELLKYESFMVTYGDGVGSINIKELVKFHKRKKVIGTLTGVHARSRWGQIYSDKNHIVTSLKQKPVFNEYINGGFMVREPEFFDYLKPDEMIEVALERLAKKKMLAVFMHDGFWHAMDTYQDMKELNDIWDKNAPWKLWGN